MLHHALRIKRPVAGVSGAYVSTGVRTTGTTHTYSAQNIGAAASDRIIVVCVAVRGSAPTSVTIGGNAMAQRATSVNGSNWAGIYSLAFPTGTTADIVVNLPGSQTGSISVYNLTLGSASATPSDTDTANVASGTSLNLTALTIPTNGFAVFAHMLPTSGGTTTWTNAISDVDADMGARHYSSAHSSTAGTPTVTCAISGSATAICLCGAAWG